MPINMLPGNEEGQTLQPEGCINSAGPGAGRVPGMLRSHRKPVWPEEKESRGPSSGTQDKADQAGTGRAETLRVLNSVGLH